MTASYEADSRERRGTDDAPQYMRSPSISMTYCRRLNMKLTDAIPVNNDGSAHIRTHQIVLSNCRHPEEHTKIRCGTQFR